jgi:hypothetical protein
VALALHAVLALAAPSAAGGEDTREEAVVVPIAPPRQELEVGERLAFEGRWFGIPVGQGWIQVTALTTRNGRPAYQIDATGGSNDFLSKFYPIRDVVKSYLDAETLQPLQFEKDQREGRYRAHEVVTFDYQRNIATYRSLLNGSLKEVPIEAGVQDLVSAVYWLRRQPIVVGTPLMVDIYSDEKVYRTALLPLKTLVLELLWRGSFAAILVEPKAAFKGLLVKRGRMLVYLTADERRIPLLVKVWTPWGLMTGTIERDALLRRSAAESRG